MFAAKKQPSPTRGDPVKGQSTIRRGRKKSDGGGIRTWFHLTDTGDTGLLDVGRYAMRHRTGISARDYRILDPMLSYSPSIHGRREALVVNMEHIKAVVTAKDVWLLNHMDPAVGPFIKKLKRQVVNYNCEDSTAVSNGDGDGDWKSTNPDQLQVLSQELKSTSSSRRQVVPVIDLQPDIVEEEGYPRTEPIPDEKQRTASPPFEFVVLEACLENICASLDLEVKTLEEQAYPTLDELKTKVSDFTLDRVRSIKGRQLFLSRRLQKMKDEVQRLLGNDEHIQEMYLTGKLRLQEERERRSDGSTDNEHRQVMEFERLLDTYLLRFEWNLNKLSLLKEQIHDMEAYVNLILDDKQNSRLNLIIMNKTAHMVLQFYTAFTALMAGSIDIPLFNVTSIFDFTWINLAWTAYTVILYVALLVFFKHKRWLT
ncbi:hypothetical protein MLD38_032402 [Melastoma candidum]|uniref:Uncharacterized protein n=1 Tax=Melastoma candidum TaxID=119954 RepID=A0ACB9M3M3_9MYRT|nr:hypothetical protein MLD38_032402 [Melastoma candidum]